MLTTINNNVCVAGRNYFGLIPHNTHHKQNNNNNIKYGMQQCIYYPKFINNNIMH